MDTATETSGENVRPRIVKNYDGGAIELNKSLGISMGPEIFDSLLTHLGEDLIVTDGTTLLGADNKAGIAEIMTAVEYFAAHPEAPHGKLCIGFTPDEEVGRGADAFDIESFGAEFAYTVDGGELGELEYENFNAAAATVRFKGNVIHPGYAKNKMRNAAHIAAEFHSMLPREQTPAHTEGYEGFYHLTGMEGDVAQATLRYIIRDHDSDGFSARKECLVQLAGAINTKYAAPVAEVEITDSYYNMKEKIAPHMELIDIARDAMAEEGIVPLIAPVRGGTDGARLSYMGLPCPNLCAGAHNTHGPYEYCSIQSMEKITAFLIRLVQKFAQVI
jgi:tripeptide aminopeptidase